jgi:5-methylcytosine-specific restriction enzyme A
MPVRPPVHNAGGRRRDYESQRGSARRQGYTAGWDRLSRTYRSTFPLCAGCLAVGRIALAQVVDHVLPAKGNPDRMWSFENLQPLCKLISPR